MTRSICLCIALLLAGLGATMTAPAADASDPMAVLYENTLTCQGEADDNWLCYQWYYPGGYYREFQVIRRRDGNMALHGWEGTYTVKRDAAELVICQSLDMGAHTWCRRMSPTRRVGDRWEETLANGRTQKLSLLKGRLLLNFLSGDGKDPHILAPYKYPDYPPDPSRIMRDIGGAASR